MLLHLNNISKGYGTPGSHTYRPVLSNLELKLEVGSVTGIIGPSGCGKTTLLNIAGALDLPDSGSVLFRGEEISRYNDAELARFRNLKLGFVFQQHHLMPHLTLWENVLLPLLPRKSRASSGDTAWAEHLLRKTGLWELKHQLPGEMSGGECQRTAVVRALINKPALVLADEPTGALDETNAAILSDLLLNLSREEGVTLLVVTHAAELASRLEVRHTLHNGTLIRGK
jgi:ABC-type lipoprotein export system ATPase subunit